MKNINNFTQWKKWISRCDVLARGHAPKEPCAVWAQSGRSTRSAVDIFNTLRVFTKEPIREQEIKLECMNFSQVVKLSLTIIVNLNRQHKQTCQISPNTYTLSNISEYIYTFFKSINLKPFQLN